MTLKMPDGHIVQLEWTLTDDSDKSIHENKALNTTDEINDDDEYTLCIAELLRNYAHMYELHSNGDFPMAFACYPSLQHNTVYVVLVRIEPPDYYTVRNITWGLPPDMVEFREEAKKMVQHCMDHLDDWPRLRG